MLQILQENTCVVWLFLNKMAGLLAWNFPANTSTLNQHWNNVGRQSLLTLFQHWSLVENESWADVHLSTLFQRWQNNVQTTSTALRQFKVNEIWNLVENESWTDVFLSTLFQRRQNICSMSITQYRFNLDIRFKIKVKSTYVHQRHFDVEEISLK